MSDEVTTTVKMLRGFSVIATLLFVNCGNTIIWSDICFDEIIVSISFRSNDIVLPTMADCESLNCANFTDSGLNPVSRVRMQERLPLDHMCRLSNE